MKFRGLVVSFTGSRDGITTDQRATLIPLLTGVQEFHHGDDKGADKDAAYLARQRDIWVVGHPPSNPYRRYFFEDNETWEPKDFMLRNDDIVACGDVLIACPNGFKEVLRSGTWATIRRGIKKPMPVVIIYPDGSVSEL